MRRETLILLLLIGALCGAYLGMILTRGWPTWVAP